MSLDQNKDSWYQLVMTALCHHIPTAWDDQGKNYYGPGIGQNEYLMKSHVLYDFEGS